MEGGRGLEGGMKGERELEDGESCMRIQGESRSDWQSSRDNG